MPVLRHKEWLGDSEQGAGGAAPLELPSLRCESPYVKGQQEETPDRYDHQAAKKVGVHLK
jgi:hypothetical protein